MTIIGQAIDRVDGPLKVTGRATYANEHWEAGVPLYGHMVGARIARGRISVIDTALAQDAPGVRLVMTHLNAPAQQTPDPMALLPTTEPLPCLNTAEIDHYGQPVALVVADSIEVARGAASLIHVEYESEPGRFDFESVEDEASIPPRVLFWPPESRVGDFDRAFDRAEVTVDVQYRTPFEFAQPMEPPACLAVPHGEDLTLYTSTQVVSWAREQIARTLRIDGERVHVVSPYVGGGFGVKIYIHYETTLAALAARHLEQPVKVAMTRQQMFQLLGMRSTSSQRVRLAAAPDGRLLALGHDATMAISCRRAIPDEPAARASGSLYAAANRLTRQLATPLDIYQPEVIRAPGDAPGLLAVESAMDELAHTLGIDPLELRLRNEPAVDPERGVPYSERRLVDCLLEGARLFGWERRPDRPATVRDGRWLVGYGMAAGILRYNQGPTRAQVRVGQDGETVVQTDMTDIGMGSYTILAQVAADVLDVPVKRVRVELGNSAFPVSSGAGGSAGTASAGNAVHRACVAIREMLRAADGHIPPEGFEAVGEIGGATDDPNSEAYSIHSYGAQYAEVGVDIDTGEARVRRMLGVFSAGRIINAKTARSQLIGGMIWGLGAALLEEAVLDTRSGAFVNGDLAGYLVPVHADIPDVEAILLDGNDDKANPLGVKGVGELGICGAGAAIANAVFNATGVRVRDFPITLEKLLPSLPGGRTRESHRGNRLASTRR
jgi:xanthine dehydrogenase YagR molybdenum-binding subunit